jgi:hypothetical protein
VEIAYSDPVAVDDDVTDVNDLVPKFTAVMQDVTADAARRLDGD